MLAILACAGCVDRRFVVESNIPNAQVYIDNRPIGAAPAHSQFEYYGDYTFTVVHPGYETKVERRHIPAPWYAYPPFDFFAEVIWPFHIEDRRHVYIELSDATRTRTDDLITAADALRMRGYSLPAADRPALPSAPPATPNPGLTPLPPPSPLVPPAGPPPGIIPGVGPGM
jgi:hypothetical protein